MNHDYFNQKKNTLLDSFYSFNRLGQTVKFLVGCLAGTTKLGKSSRSQFTSFAGGVQPSSQASADSLKAALLSLVISLGYILQFVFWSGTDLGFSNFIESRQSVSSSVFVARRRNRRRKTDNKVENQEKAASYSRYSSQNQREESIQQQQEVCRQKAITIGHSISSDLEFADRAVSGTKLNRDGLNQLLESAKNGEFNVLYFYSLSRLARESVITMPILKKLVNTYKIRCICVSEGIDTDVTGWELIASIYSIIHEQFIADLKAAVLRGQEGALLEGFSVGDWCFGYGSEPVPGTEQTRPGRNSKPRMIYIINEEHAEWVNQIFTWFVDDGYSIGKIVRELNRLRAPKDHRSTSHEWHHNLVVGILSNEKYIGKWPWGENQNERDPETGIISQEPRLDEECEKWTRELLHLCIIDTCTFQKAQEKLNANAEKWEQHRRDNGCLNGSSAETNGRRRVKLLHGLLKCAKCGSPFYNTGRRTQCRGAKRGTCDVVTSVPMEVLETMIVGEIGEIINGDELWFDYTLNELIQCYHEYESRVPAAIRGIERVLQQVSQKIERLLDRVEAGDLSRDLNLRLQRRNEERETLQEQLASLQRGRVQDREAPTAAWLREQLSSMHEDLQVTSPTANQTLRNLIKGKIILEEIDIPLRKRKALRGTFRLTAHGVSGEAVNGTPTQNAAEHAKLISIDFIQPDATEIQREIAKEMYDNGEPMKNIAEALNVGRSRVTLLLHEAFGLLGLKKPDGRQRRWQLDTEHLKPLFHQNIADNVMEMFHKKKSYGEIAQQLGVDRNVITAAVKFWHQQNGLPVPDGRSRRKTL